MGYLWDGGGDDSYHARFGPSQGAAHDLSVGFLLDCDGDDYYSASDGQGLSLTNSTALFIDLSGSDTYLSRGTGQGSVRWARGSGGVGVFLDLADHDVYTGSAGADSSLWIRDYYGVGLDAAFVTPPEEITQDEIGHPEDLDLDSLFSVAGEWGVSENRERVLAHRQELASRGEAAVDYVLGNHLGTLSGLELRAIEEVLEGNYEYSMGLVVPMLDSLTGRELRNCLYLLGQIGDTVSVPRVTEILQSSDSLGIRLGAIRALGKSGVRSVVPVLLELVADSSSRLRRQVAVSLGELGDSLSLPSLELLSADSSIDVRSAAEAALRAFAEDGQD